MNKPLNLRKQFVDPPIVIFRGTEVRPTGVPLIPKDIILGDYEISPYIWVNGMPIKSDKITVHWTKFDFVIIGSDEVSSKSYDPDHVYITVSSRNVTLDNEVMGKALTVDILDREDYYNIDDHETVMNQLAEILPLYKIEMIESTRHDVYQVKYYRRTSIDKPFKKVYDHTLSECHLYRSQEKLEKIKKLYQDEDHYLPTKETVMFRIMEDMYSFEYYGENGLFVTGYNLDKIDTNHGESLKFGILDYTYVELFDAGHLIESHGYLYMDGKKIMSVEDFLKNTECNDMDVFGWKIDKDLLKTLFPGIGEYEFGGHHGYFEKD